MTIGLSAVLVLCGLVAVNLVLTAGIIRKLREYERERAGHTGGSWQPGLADGTKVPSFTAATTTGETVDEEILRDGVTLVGFFSTDCGSCLPKAPAFADTAASTPALAVVSTGRTAADDLLQALDAVGRVVVEAEGGPVATAFAVAAYPLFFLVGPDGAVLASGHELDPLRRLARA
ncbi:TlpA disulfide reductase family protein [Acrocarpospora sp. B8E8]|uniref:TlpA family protein disulfide reductase n=1 Tax=Acrocarpospora sp. B8E8 TaxID=3153572 RepID=UPI00325D9FCE